jgi:hypothetical protein
MPVNINAPDAFERMVHIEGQTWREQQSRESQGTHEYSFLYALSKHQNREGPAVIYGEGGWSRWLVTQEGEIILLRSTTTATKVEAAIAAGFTVAGYTPAEMNRHAEEQRKFQQQRMADMTSLCAALIAEVAVSLGYSPEQAEKILKDKTAVLTAMLANRILAWVNHRLGLVSDEIMADHATVCRQRTEDDRIVRLPCDLGLKLAGSWKETG